MLLDVKRLSVSCNGRDESSSLLHDITFGLREGEVLGIIGESGSGKTTLVRGLTNLFPASRRMRSEGAVLFDGRDLLSVDEHVMSSIRRTSIRYIFQEPASSFNPLMRIQTQFTLAQSSDDNFSDRSPYESIVATLTQMGLTSPAEVLRSYPHQLSVGTLQRVLIAMATIEKPRLLIADEPTSAVDASQRYQILDLLQDQCRTHGMALLLTTHDLSIVRTYADQIIVLYAGRIVEVSRKDDFFSTPLHPYSSMLLESISSSSNSLDQVHITPEKSSGAKDRSKGCKFSSRCPRVHDDCKIVEPELLFLDEERKVRCPYWK